MKRGLYRKTSFTQTAGLRLRCFLKLRSFWGGAIWTLLCLAGASSSRAQIDIPKPERLTHAEGYVVNSAGKPAVDVEVTLTRDEKVAFRTRTDRSGGFRFDHLSGPYLFRVERSENAPAAREIVVTDEIVTHLEQKKLYVILGPGACMDECSSVLTSKREFDRSIREKNRH
jgi:hypothetical protein